MKAKLGKCMLFLLGLVALQQGIAFGNGHVDRLGRQAAVIEANDIDPAAIFYTESPLALAAEKRVRHRVNTSRYTTLSP
jgi:hypothetical protein